MNDSNGYAVFLFPQALEALGDAIKPYLQEGATGPHVLCNGIDTSGSLIEMTLRGNTTEGKLVVLDLMVPVSMVRMIVSSQSDEGFGFGPRIPVDVVRVLPPIGPTAVPATADPVAFPDVGASTAPAAESVSPAAPSPGAGSAKPEA